MQDTAFISEPAQNDIVPASPKDQTPRSKMELAEKQQSSIVAKLASALLDRSPGSNVASAAAVTDQQDLPLSAVAPTDQQEGMVKDEPGSHCALTLSTVIRSHARFARRTSHHGGLEHPLLPALDDAMLRQLARDIKLSVPDESNDCSQW